MMAQNIDYRESGFAGPVSCPSGKTFFVNIQTPGLTLAVAGKWKL
jgi:secreted PhoX family phosphatase